MWPVAVESLMELGRPVVPPPSATSVTAARRGARRGWEWPGGSAQQRGRDNAGPPGGKHGNHTWRRVAMVQMQGRGWEQGEAMHARLRTGGEVDNAARLGGRSHAGVGKAEQKALRQQGRHTQRWLVTGPKRAGDLRLSSA